jgi:hypothetical protein
MAPRSISFAAGFACGALLFIAMQSFGQGDEVQCRDADCAARELPALDRAPDAALGGVPDETPEGDRKAASQSDVLPCRDLACAAAPELPGLGQPPQGRKAEKEKNLFIPVAATVGMIGVLSLWGKNSTLPCAQYPCAHYAHVGTGAAIGYLFTSYYSPGAAFGAGLAVGVGKEIMDKQNGKSFSRTDVVTRLLGTGLGVYIARTF